MTRWLALLVSLRGCPVSELRDRDEIEADLAEYERVFRNAELHPALRRLVADVGPLLERLDQADADFKDLDHRWSERFRQQTAEIERLSSWRRLWRDRYRNLWGISEQYRAEIAAAQARVERLESACRRALENLDDPSFGLAEQTLAAAKLRAALAGDAARPKPQERPRCLTPTSCVNDAYPCMVGSGCADDPRPARPLPEPEQP